MDKAQKVVVILGVGLAAMMIAQTVYRSGTTSMHGWEWNKTAERKVDDEASDETIRRFGTALGLDWDAVNKVVAADKGLYDEYVGYGADPKTPGVVFNVGGVSGKPYTLIDDELYYMSGR